MAVGAAAGEGATPTGTVTFLLSDIEGSTELWQRLPAAMPQATADHDRIMREVLAGSQGYEFGTAGDSFAVAYTSPVAAEHAGFARDYLDRSENPWAATCIPPLAMYEATRGFPESGHRLCMRGVEITTDGELGWTLASTLACRARIALRYNVGDPRADLVHALEVGRDLGAWYGVWLAMAEAVAWLHEHQIGDAATIVAGYMSKRDIWFRPLAADFQLENSTDSAGRLGSSMQRDELIDYLVSELVA